MMKLFVAGGSGVIGREFLRLAVAAGHEVIGMTRSQRGVDVIRALGGAPVVADALDGDEVADAVGAARPDAVVNLLTDLASGDLASNAQLRIVGTRHLVDAAMKARVETIVAESISWVYPSSAEFATEETPLDLEAPEPRLRTVRAIARLEEVVREMPRSVVLRFGQLYGDGTWFSRDGRYGIAAREGRMPATRTVASFIHVEDAARAAFLALGWPSGTWNIVDDEPARGTEWAPVFAGAVGAPRPSPEESDDPGRPVSNRRAHESGLVLTRPTWRTGFAE
ncbi:NAD(P)-dependent oxidoreductase [Microbacterium testaceum]|uniref:NAD-dependent epimerase/dehydratase family protein n=1 Tax=Microbacterium testaceum TaxID=2033 RepID=UPI003432DD35